MTSADDPIPEGADRSLDRRTFLRSAMVGGAVLAGGVRLAAGGGISAIGTARAQQLYQPLVQLSNEAQVQYVLAEEIVPSGSTSQWHIKLRKGVTFHDGKPFGADDVLYTLRTILNPKKPLGGAEVLAPVDLKGLKKLDEHTVSVPMTSPFGSFVEQLASLW